ncbi:enoyl-CoA hydratase/isomerase family protein [Spirillospora sp. CA-255316]
MGTIDVKVHDAVAIVEICNPGRRNAWTRAMRADFVAALAGCADGTTPCDAVVITGGTEDAFCAGQDLDEAIEWKPDGAVDEMRELRHTYDAVRRCPKPVVAAVNGVAAGSGFQIALCSDSTVTHPGARLGQPEIRTGMSSAIGVRLLQMSVGFARMKDIILQGRLLYGHEAHAWGLINYLVPAESVLPTALEVARKLAAIPQASFASSKLGLALSFDADFDDAFAATADHQRRLHEQGVAQSLRTAQVSKR